MDIINRQELEAELVSRRERNVESRRLWIASEREELQSVIDQQDAFWAEVEQKHNKAMSDPRANEAWVRSLLMVREERRMKYVAIRADLSERLQRLEKPPDIGSIDFTPFAPYLDSIEREISKYSPVLSVKRRQLEYVGEYGNVEDESWLSEVSRFVAMNPSVVGSILALELATKAAGVAFDWNAFVIHSINATIVAADKFPDVQLSTGLGFERSCLEALVKVGWVCHLTQTIGDQGVDILARKDGISVALQCKNYSAPVGNGAVQEVHAGKGFYETDFAVVVSPSGYTKSARQLADRLDVRLIDSSLLMSLEDFL